ncbi:hypothetical protein [Alistipes sp. ZOR0009]|uniref:hypothetical protein n=1 Tax=Alistipes sp. ZOR0009 TaxID=1339253 RepID=UPI0006479DD9|nr:hypothetical protein [Alistipes sp. ZOR0009]
MVVVFYKSRDSDLFDVGYFKLFYQLSPIFRCLEAETHQLSCTSTVGKMVIHQLMSISTLGKMVIHQLMSI